MKTLIAVALALATALSGSFAYAQTERPNVHRRYHHHYPPHHPVHHDVAHGPGATSERAGAAIEGAPSRPDQMFKPYANPGEGDDDGLSRDPDDCMKGCIGGNPG